MEARTQPADGQSAAAKAIGKVGARGEKKMRRTGPAKLFVLDTNVLLHDPMCLFRFEEHDIFLPMIVLEELDGHKKGMTEVARNARQTSRTLDALAGTPGADITSGFKLDSTGQREAKGKLMFQTLALDYSLPGSLPQGKADNQILGVVAALRTQYAPREVVLVSKDINMRVKARALGLATDDYHRGYRKYQCGGFVYYPASERCARNRICVYVRRIRVDDVRCQRSVFPHDYYGVNQ
jgi:PhoH-like ATPase